MSKKTTPNFKAALLNAKSVNKSMRKALVSNKSVAVGIKLKATILSTKDGKTPSGNDSRELTVQVLEIEDFPSKVATVHPDKPGVVLARVKEKTAPKKYTYSDLKTELKPGDIFKLGFIEAGTTVIPTGLDVGKTFRFFSVAPKTYRYAKAGVNETTGKAHKAGDLSVDSDGNPRVFWGCASSVEQIYDLDNPGKVIGNLQQHLPFHNFTMNPEKPFKFTKGQRESSTSITTLCFGGHVPSNDDGQFVVNAGVVDPDGMEYLKEGQGAWYMTFGATVLTFQCFKHREPRVNWNDPVVERELYQQTAIRLITNQNVLIRQFMVTEKQTWELVGPHFARALDGLIVVKDPYDRDPTLSAKVQEFADSIEFDDGGSEKARALIDEGKAVKRGAVVSVNKMILNFPKMIRDIGTLVPLDLASKATRDFAAAKQMNTDPLVKEMQQNVLPNPYLLNVIGLHAFIQSTTPASLSGYDIYVITPNEDWNNGSGKTAEEVMAEYAENEDRSKSKKTFDPDHCLFYAVHRRTLDAVQDAVAGIPAEALDMDIEDAGPSSSNKRDREEETANDDDLFGDTEDMDEPPKKKKKKNKSKVKNLDEE